MSWIALTEAHVLTKLTAPEVAALKTAATATGQADPLPEIVAQIVREVRGHVAGCAKNTLGPAGTIPDELQGAALNRVRYELATRLPVASLLTDARKESNRDALTLLQRVASCQFALVQPETAGEQPSAPLIGHWGGAAKWSRDSVGSDIAVE